MCVITNDIIDAVAQRLGETSRTIKDILDDLDIKDHPKFYRMFKDKYNMTPSQYRTAVRSATEAKPQTNESGDSIMDTAVDTVNAGQAVDLVSPNNGWLPHTGNIDLSPYTKLVSIKYVDLTISSEKIPEQTISIDVNHVFMAGRSKIASKNTAIQGLGECTVEVELHATGRVVACIAVPGTTGYVDCQMRAMVHMSIEFDKKAAQRPAQQPYTPGIPRATRGLHGGHSTPTHPDDRGTVVYTLREGTWTFVVGLDEDVRLRDDYELLDTALNDHWVKENLADLEPQQRAIVTGVGAIRMSVDRAVYCQETLVEMLVATEGVAAFAAEVNGVKYLLPMVDRNATRLGTDTVAALNMVYWNQIETYLPSTLSELAAPFDSDVRVVSGKEALNLQVDWAMSMSSNK